ncbi:MAG: cell division protein FtsQ/DivIB [Actinomycetota bacterium]
MGLFLIAAAVLALSVGAFLVSRSSALHARAVEVTGASHLSRSSVLATSGVSTRTNVLWLDEGAIERRLASDPWITGADVRVAFPWTVEIAIVERSPIAVATDGLHQTLVAADGTALGTATRTRGLPRIELGATTAVEGIHESPVGAAAALGAMAPELRARVASVGVLIDGTLELRLRGGVTVRYGTATEVRSKAATIERILAWAEEEGEALRLVTVVSPDRAAVKLVA